MEEAISRNLQCANSEAGKRVAKKMGSGYAYAPATGFMSAPPSSSVTDKTSTPYEAAKDYLDKSTEFSNQLILQNKEARQKATADAAKGARQY